jgi:hypothetical protein
MHEVEKPHYLPAHLALQLINCLLHGKLAKLFISHISGN